MSGVITVSNEKVDELIYFTEEIGARSPGWFKAECEKCGTYTTGSEPTVEDWAYEHVSKQHQPDHVTVKTSCYRAWAQCTCGFRGGDYCTREKAQARADQHTAESGHQPLRQP